MQRTEEVLRRPRSGTAARVLAGVGLIALGIGIGATATQWYRANSGHSETLPISAAAATERTILYYRDPSGAPYWSASPRKDETGRDYLPVYDDEEQTLGPAPAPRTASDDRRILYYRNPMGLPDTSPVPKKDWMGMDYIPVYEGEEDDGVTVRVSLDRVQRSGVRTEAAAPRSLARPVRAFGTVAVDERLLTVVTMRADGFIEELFVNATGQAVAAGDPLFRIYSPQIQQAQTDLLVAARAEPANAARGTPYRLLEGPMQRLRNLGVHEDHIRRVLDSGVNLRTLDWPAPIAGTILRKNVMNGQRVSAGEELYRIADLSRVWLMAEVAEDEIGLISPGMTASVTFRAWPAEPFEGTVTFIYPELNARTRTGRIRIEMDNPGGRLKPHMYADVVLRAGDASTPLIAVPESAVIDSGARQVVLVAKGEGRFEPREVTLGVRADGYVEVRTGIAEGEEVVTAATFLIDAESNLKAALRAFTQPEPAQ